jgi:hypothetical protein
VDWILLWDVDFGFCDGEKEKSYDDKANPNEPVKWPSAPVDSTISLAPGCWGFFSKTAFLAAASWGEQCLNSFDYVIKLKRRGKS